jgi:FkbM family methyltransferase
LDLSANKAKAYVKFQGKVWLTRLGLSPRLERWRLGRRFRAGRAHEQEFAFFRHFDGSRRLFVDIGANLGQSALSFRTFNRTCPILSFEPNPDMEKPLRYVQRLLGPSFQFRLHGLGADNAVLRYYIPVVHGVPLAQEATFNRDVLETDAIRAHIFTVTICRHFTIEERTITVMKLDDLELDPGFVKIDVQGTELDVLKGMARTIDQSRPLFLIEGYGSVLEFLSVRNYRFFVYNPPRHCLEPYHEQKGIWNFFFVPGEMIRELKDRQAVRE